jgi:hypothetical protein
VLGSALGDTVVTWKPSAFISSAAAEPSAPATRTLGAVETRTAVPKVSFCGRESRSLWTVTSYP